MSKSIVVFGIGAVGGTIAAYLAKAGHPVTVLDPWYAHVLAVQERGLHVTDPAEEFTVRVRALHADQAREIGEPIDVLVLSVKSYDTEWATRYMAPYLAPDGFVVSAQNSINEEIIASVVGTRKTMGLVVMTSAGVFEPGKLIRYTTKGDRMEFEFGELDGSDTPRIREMASLFSDIGISKTTSNIWGTLWSKLVHNCMANALSGLTGLSSNPMYMNATARRVMARVGREAVLVGEAHGIKFDEIYGVHSSTFKRLEAGGEQEISEAILKEARARTGARDNPPSLLQDVQKGRRSEVDYLNGLVVRKGAQKGVPAPLNQALTEAMHQVDGKLLKPGVQNLELFREYL